MDILLIVVQWLHVFLAIWWFGSILNTRISLFPILRRLGPDIEQPVRRELLSEPRWMLWAQTWGTVALGTLRGAMVGAFGRLGEPYGITFLAALIIGFAMAAWVNIDLPERLYTPFARRLYVAGFPLMFTLMILMRFGY